MMLNNKFLATVKKFNMLSAGDTVLVGVSGGADSVCLLHLLKSFECELGISVKAAHVNHCIRGPEADSDENYVRELCKELDIPLFVLHVDIPSLSAKKNISTELCAREERYKFFDGQGCDKIATAHTATDCIETVLMNMTRGSTLHGLCGIPPVRDNIIRPLIEFSREDTERYCKENNLSFVTDSTNLTDDYTRNKFRHNIVVNLREINPAFENNMLRMINSLRCEDDFINFEVDRFLSSFYDPKSKMLPVEPLRSCHPTIKNRVIARFISDNSDADYEMKHINFAAEKFTEKFALNLPGGSIIFSDGKNIGIKKEIHKDLPDDIMVSKYDNETIHFGNCKISFYVADKPEKNTDKLYCVDFFGLDDIIVVRTRKSGDKITLLKRRVTKTLKKLFNEIGIPADERDHIPVIADSTGVIAVGGLGVNATRVHRNDTDKFLIIKTECDKNE